MPIPTFLLLSINFTLWTILCTLIYLIGVLTTSIKRPKRKQSVQKRSDINESGTSEKWNLLFSTFQRVRESGNGPGDGNRHHFVSIELHSGALSDQTIVGCLPLFRYRQKWFLRILILFTNSFHTKWLEPLPTMGNRWNESTFRTITVPELYNRISSCLQVQKHIKGLCDLWIMTYPPLFVGLWYICMYVEFQMRSVYGQIVVFCMVRSQLHGSTG